MLTIAARCPPCPDLDNEFKPTGQLDLNLVTRTEATAAFATLAMLFSLGSIICVVFGLGRTGYGSAISRAAIVMLISGALARGAAAAAWEEMARMEYY